MVFSFLASLAAAAADTAVDFLAASAMNFCQPPTAAATPELFEEDMMLEVLLVAVVVWVLLQVAVFVAVLACLRTRWPQPR